MSSTQVAKKTGRKATTASTPAAPVVAAPVAAPVVAAPAVITHVEAAAPAAAEEVNVVSQFNTIVESVNKLLQVVVEIYRYFAQLINRYIVGR